MESIETIRENINEKQKKLLINKLIESDFYVSESGHVCVKNPKENHPHWGSNHYLPVGFIGKDYAELVNLDNEFPEDYHSQLRDIYRSI
jgi:hypothetical protein